MLVFLCQLGLSGCKNSGPQENLSEDLIVGTSADAPPFEYHKTTGKEDLITGFDIDIVREIANHLKKGLDVRDMEFSSLIPALQTHRVNIVISSLSPSEERRKTVDFSNIYFESVVAVITPKNIEITKDEDFKNKRIGVQLGAVHEPILQAIHKKQPSMTIVTRNKLGELIQEIHAGRLDGVAMDLTTAQNYVSTNPGLHVTQLPQYKVSFAIALRKNSPLKHKINETLDHLRKSGTLDRLIKKWFPQE